MLYQFSAICEENCIFADKELRTAIIREAAMQDPNMKTGRNVVASVLCEICLKLS